MKVRRGHRHRGPGRHSRRRRGRDGHRCHHPAPAAHRGRGPPTRPRRARGAAGLVRRRAGAGGGPNDHLPPVSVADLLSERNKQVTLVYVTSQFEQQFGSLHPGWHPGPPLPARSRVPAPRGGHPPRAGNGHRPQRLLLGLGTPRRLRHRRPRLRRRLRRGAIRGGARAGARAARPRRRLRPATAGVRHATAYALAQGTSGLRPAGSRREPASTSVRRAPKLSDPSNGERASRRRRARPPLRRRTRAPG